MYLLLLAFLFAISPLLVGQTDPQFPPKVVVENIGITNDSLVSSENLQQLREEITKQQYGKDAQDEIAERARYELQKEGYFKADVITSDLQLQNEAPGQRTVAVTLRINEGQQYRLEQINFVHNRVFASSQLRPAFAIKEQDVFDTEKIRLGIDELRRMYASEGYINFVPVPNTKANDQAGTISLVMDIDEGKRFRVESLILSGTTEWPEKDVEELRGIFRHYAGSVNVSELLQQLEAATLAMFPGLDSAHDLVEVQQNAERGTVNIRIVRPVNH
jgi:outer membrane translocation and assembly module TamA